MLTPSVRLPEGWTAQKAFEAARINLKRGALDAALAFAQQACQAEPNDVSFQALHAWLRAQREDLKPGPAADAILAVLHRAVRQQRDNLEFRMHRARILQRLGRTEEAIRDFSVVASMDPKNVDAAREVRLHRLRAEQKASSSGLLSKLFSRPPK